MTTDDQHDPGKPVIALMGEFSAGKSTLANLLVCEGRSPVKVTATQLPPVWFSYGTGDAYRVGLDGNKGPVDLDRIEDIDVDDTLCIRVFMETDILDLMDIIDMPGNSDPNMSPEVWQRMIHHADGVVWCSHATQAWRQSEAATWEELPDYLCDYSILLLTRFDKLLTDSDRSRVLKRVRSETRGEFRAVFPLSLLQAVEAGESRELWEASGAEEFLQSLLDTVLELESHPRRRKKKPLRKIDNAPIPLHEHAKKRRAALPPEATAPSVPGGPAVAPRRVAKPAGSARARPRPSA